MHRVVYACVAWLYQLVVTSGYAGISLVSCFVDIIQAVSMAWVGLQWALKHEAREAFFVVLTVYISTALRVGKGSTLVTETLRHTCRHGVSWAREELDVRTSAVGNV